MKRLILFQYVIYLVISFGFWNCNNNQHQDNDYQVDSTNTNITKADSLSIYLPTAQSNDLLPATQHITVANDPVFHTSKTYEAVDFREVLEKLLPAYKHLDIAKTQLVFECEDGYNPSMPLQKILDKKAYIAIADVAAPEGTKWINPQKDGREMKMEPFYFIYTDVSADDVTYKWPYNLVKLSLVSASAEQEVLFPKEDDRAVKGYELFKVNCLTCHALNRVGGKMGPELNYPKSIVEYWRSEADIKAFVKAPTTYRYDAKMPAVKHLTDNDLNQILYYLQYMAKHKPKN